MTLLEFNKILESTGYPVAFRAFPTEEVPEPPYICYQTPETNTFYADGEVIYSTTKVVIDLFTVDKDARAERQVEAALNKLTWTKDELYLTTEKIYSTQYEVEI